MNELSLQQIHVGDTISGQTDSGMSFTAVIKEISQYPDSDGASYMSDSQNSNASYYPFYALIEDTEDISEGDSATLQLSGGTINDPDAIYLEDFFIRTEKDGRNYVYMKGEDGTAYEAVCHDRQEVELGRWYGNYFRPDKERPDCISLWG